MTLHFIQYHPISLTLKPIQIIAAHSVFDFSLILIYFINFFISNLIPLILILPLDQNLKEYTAFNLINYSFFDFLKSPYTYNNIVCIILVLSLFKFYFLSAFCLIILKFHSFLLMIGYTKFINL